MADITLDQLIADLCVIRGKCPKTGKWKLVKAEVDGENFYLEITNGKKNFVIGIEASEKD